MTTLDLIYSKKSTYHFKFSNPEKDVTPSKLTKADLLVILNALGYPNRTDNAPELKEFLLNEVLSVDISDGAVIFQRTESNDKLTKCNISTCNVLCLNRQYCAYKHNHCEFILQQKEYFQKEVDVVGIYLSTMMLKEANSGSSNCLKPSGKPPRVPRKDTLLEFYTSHKKYIPLLQAHLGVNIDGSECLKFRDQKERALELAKMLNESHRIVRLMDGHCGLLLTFLGYVIELYGRKRLNYLQIELVDIDPEVNDWHSLMYNCPRIHCLNENIVKDNFDKSILVYMNFCGISLSFNEVLRFLEYRYHEQSDPSVCMLSFSVFRKAASKNYKTKLTKMLKGSKWKMKSIDKQLRNDFLTFVFVPSD